MAALRITLLALLLAPLAHAQEAADRAQLRELDKLRQRVANEVQLSAYDLLDELVYGWTLAPPFDKPTPVFLAGLTAPVGMGSGLVGLMENHLAHLLVSNPKTHVTLSHCPACSAVVMHSGATGTIVSRGIDNPEALAKLGGLGGRHGLYIDVEAEGAWLVLRARIVELTPDLPIIYSRTLSSPVGAPSMLRHPTQLKSADAARQEYLNALKGLGPFSVPIRFTVRAYQPGSQTNVAPAPVLWMQSGVEMALTQTRAWMASVLVGYAWLPEAYDGVMLQTRMSRLLSGSSRSLTRPNLYAFFGGAIMTLNGPTMAPFKLEDSQELMERLQADTNTRATFGAFHAGLDLRLGNRMGVSMFLENMPAYIASERIGVFLENGILPLHSFGAEVTFWF